MRIHKICFSFFLILSLGNNQIANAQTIEPYIGYAIDLNNKEHFGLSNLGIQYAMVDQPYYKLFLGVSGSISIPSNRGVASAFSPNTNLALMQTAQRRTNASILSLSLVNRFRVAAWQKNVVSAVVGAGLALHKIKVRHSGYDKENYSILNPHRNYSQGGIFGLVGTQYDRSVRNGRLFVQVTACTSLLTKWDEYYYQSLAPLSLNIGYGFDLTKSKSNEKE